MTKPTETEVAAPIVEWFKAQDWNTYTEVQPDRNGGPIADIVATKGSLTWIVEVKTSRSLALLDQSYRWVAEANLVSVATPAPKRTNLAAVAWDPMCRSLGLGSFEVNPYGVVSLIVFPRLNRKLLGTDGIRSALRDEQRDWAPAGNSSGSRWTPFQGLVRALRILAADSPGFRLSDFAEATEHHYATDKHAVAALKRQLHDGTIPGLFVRCGKVYEEGYNRHSVKA